MGYVVEVYHIVALHHDKNNSLKEIRKFAEIIQIGETSDLIEELSYLFNNSGCA